MDQLIAIFVLFGMLIVGYVFFTAPRRPRAPEEGQDTGDSDPNPDSGSGSQTDSEDLNSIAAELETPFEKMAHPGDALTDPLFERAVGLLCTDDYPATRVMNYALGSNWVLQCAGFEALRRRDDSANLLDRARTRLADLWAWPLYFAIRYLDSKSSGPEIVNILVSAREWWPKNPMLCEELGTVFRRRLGDGEQVVLGRQFSALPPENRNHVVWFVAALPQDVRPRLEAVIARYARNAIDEPFLRSVGELLTTHRIDEPVYATKQLSRLLKELAAEAADNKPTSILIVGESGVGKTALRREFARQLLGQGWRIFKTAASNIIADKIYIGEIEGQVRRLSENATVAKHVAVFVDRLNELDEFGRHKDKNSSVLDQLWPKIESREMFFVSETTPSGLQAMLRRFPSLPTAMKVVRMVPADEQATAEMANALLDQAGIDVSQSQKDEVVAEALQLSEQYLSHKALPGSVLSLVELSVLRAQRDEDDQSLNRTHVLGALSQVSGLPTDVLDERQQLDVDAIRDAFTKRIIGQDEAVECLVERIAMLKAGLTDPSRPVGVFLFAGPTGTGKTEIAKTLAEFLFGSPEQMIRLDMSEYQNPDSAWRLIDEGDSHGNKGSLATRIREQPFSVVLLDEFEKAHVKVWDMFLQVFDDGRLTDSKGGLADFRHSIIILTSNLGSKISNEAGIGFTSARGEFSADDVMRTVNRTFRREFVNRLDRVVVFNPLGRDVMRAILRKELQLALERRGLRTKQWAVEWEDSAVEFLLDEGFTPDLGARPLRRAIEKHLLAPLSITMVQNEAPDGEQFLFVRSNGEALQVEFIDPDADEISESPQESEDPAPDLTVQSILQATTMPKGASALLATEMAMVQERVASDAWADRKAGLIAQMNGADFWEHDNRHAVMDQIELMDRIDTAASVLGRLAGRLERSGRNTSLIKGIANRIFVLREGLRDFDDRRSTQAIIGVRLVTADAGLPGANAFRDNLIHMYRNWARARGMRLRELDASRCRYEALFLVSGFGSFGLLDAESGLHVFEVPAGATRFDRIRARVEVAAVPASGLPRHEDNGAVAAGLLDADKTRKVVIVRRYRQEPSPLARDSVRQWRTGRLDFVFDGNFDVIS
jgi:ATP-dependent Clp protease ATP-binding subunit ClpC